MNPRRTSAPRIRSYPCWARRSPSRSSANPGACANSPLKTSTASASISTAIEARPDSAPADEDGKAWRRPAVRCNWIDASRAGEDAAARRGLLVDLGMAAKIRPALLISVPAEDIDRALVTKLLLARGASVDVRDGAGRTPLMLAVRACVDSYWKERRSPESVAALLSAGASVEGVALPTGYAEIDPCWVVRDSDGRQVFRNTTWSKSFAQSSVSLWSWVRRRARGLPPRQRRPCIRSNGSCRRPSRPRTRR